MTYKKHWPLLVCGIVVIAVALAGRAGVPLYDGVGFPDEPYRYVKPPAGLETEKPPSSADASGIAADGFTKDGIYMTTTEQQPQIYVTFSQRVFAVPAEATLVSTQVQPLAPDGSTTEAGTVVGNIYRLTATSDSGSATFVPSERTPSYVVMRLPQGYPEGATMVYRSGPQAAWQALRTGQVGADIYEVRAKGLGDYAMTSKKTIASPKSQKNWLLPAVVAGVVLLASAALLYWQLGIKRHA